MAKSDDIHKKKLSFLEEREDALRNKVGAAEIKLYEILVDNLLDEIESENGTVKNTPKNINLLNRLDNLFDQFNGKINLSIIDQYVKDINTNKTLNSSYFELFAESKKKFDLIRSKISASTDKLLGLDKDGKIVKKGFLDSFLKDNRNKNEIQTLLIKGITGGASIKDLKSDVKFFVQGDKEKTGALSKQYSTLIYDTYQQIDRTESNIYSEELGMDAFIYSGGKVRDTRKFCCQRNGLIFTKEEAKAWRTLKFHGKPKNYNPLVDLGGYNCRHSTQYISNVIAAKRRDDLELDDNGKLVYSKSGSKQRLHSC